jgi:hypothetical protein
MNKNSQDDLTYLAAIITSDIADGSPIMYAERSTPVDEADSGWQFLGTTFSYRSEKALVWSLREVLDLEPTLTGYIHAPYGTKLARSTKSSQWQVV